MQSYFMRGRKQKRLARIPVFIILIFVFLLWSTLFTTSRRKKGPNSNDPERLAGGFGAMFNHSRFLPHTTYLEAISSCHDFECLHDAHTIPRPAGMFPFPSFLIIGWQNCATTSLYSHLKEHPQIVVPAVKEAEFFTFSCNYSFPDQCSKFGSNRYIQGTLKMEEYIASEGRKAAFEVSTHIVRSGNLLSDSMYHYLPWLKLIISIREPISRAISILAHLKELNQSGCLSGKSSLFDCLLHESQMGGVAPYGVRGMNYSFPMKDWLDSWPQNQIHVIQYEGLIGNEEQPQLQKIKEFLGLNPYLPANSTLDLTNSVENKIQPKGWPMKRHEYEALIDFVKPDIDELLNLLENSNKIQDREQWMRRWESIWKSNLDSCDEEGQCTIQLV